MISIDDARTRILAPLTPTPPEIVPLAQAWSRVTAAPVIARTTQPPADVSAMDGYALHGGSGSSRRVIGTAPAGHPFTGRIAPDEAVRLFTGSIIPDGADTVLIQEDADAANGHVTPRVALRPGAHIRRGGGDFAAGQVLIPAGTRLNARAIGLAAAGNNPWVAVHRRPVVAILATGDEIALPGDPIPPGGIVSSNAHALASLVHAHGGLPTILPIACDTPEAVSAAAAMARGADLLVTTGGASVGDFDLIQPGLAAHGFSLDFWQIAMRPGKPLLFGQLGPVPVLGLPGNPVSALVCGILFLVPALDRLLGLPGSPPRAITARSGGPLQANDHRADHLRATITHDGNDGIVATAFDRQDSSMLNALYRADALILRAPQAPALAEGDEISIISLHHLGI